FCAPGRTRTCNLRIRSKTAPVRLVLPGRIAAGRAGSTVQLITSRPVLSHQPDCQRDCQVVATGPSAAACSIRARAFWRLDSRSRNTAATLTFDAAMTTSLAVSHGPETRAHGPHPADQPVAGLVVGLLLDDEPAVRVGHDQPVPEALAVRDPGGVDLQDLVDLVAVLEPAPQDLVDHLGRGARLPEPAGRHGPEVHLGMQQRGELGVVLGRQRLYEPPTQGPCHVPPSLPRRAPVDFTFRCRSSGSRYPHTVDLDAECGALSIYVVENASSRCQV